MKPSIYPWVASRVADCRIRPAGGVSAFSEDGRVYLQTYHWPDSLTLGSTLSSVGPLPSEKGTHKNVGKTLSFEMAQVEARIGPCLPYLGRIGSAMVDLWADKCLIQGYLARKKAPTPIGQP